jgi:hypothetical protein
MNGSNGVVQFSGKLSSQGDNPITHYLVPIPSNVQGENYPKSKIPTNCNYFLLDNKYIGD